MWFNVILTHHQHERKRIHKCYCHIVSNLDSYSQQCQSSPFRFWVWEPWPDQWGVVDLFLGVLSYEWERQPKWDVRIFCHRSLKIFILRRQLCSPLYRQSWKYSFLKKKNRQSIYIAQLFLWCIENYKNPELQAYKPWLFVMERKGKKKNEKGLDRFLDSTLSRTWYCKAWALHPQINAT